MELQSMLIIGLRWCSLDGDVAVSLIRSCSVVSGVLGCSGLELYSETDEPPGVGLPDVQGVEQIEDESEKKAKTEFEEFEKKLRESGKEV
uniref:Uncharacterized protein n=1 Tax=Timema monikensis TaxID=170555 RepID=A0A7R9EID9_9NEOP|nr:unnamed protein product [Timema monikensis]